MNLADWRAHRKLTLREVAEAVGVTAMSVSRIEKGTQRPSPQIAQKIDTLTNGQVTAASLLGLAEVKPRRGVREDAAAFDGRPTVTIEVPLPPERAKLLKDSGADITAIARAGADRALKEAEAKAWAEANREAIEASNAWIEKHGTFAEQLGLI
jgi:post-segregation antitoxin (ccd killing protein)/DNA-binding XRE family transcriptional regulator